MYQETNQLVTKGDINELKQDLKTFIMDGFTALNEKIDRVDEKVDRMLRIESES